MILLKKRKLFKNHWIFTNDHFPCITKQASAFFIQWIPLGAIDGKQYYLVWFYFISLTNILTFISSKFNFNALIGSLHSLTSSNWFFLREYDEGGKTRVETTFSYCK